MTTDFIPPQNLEMEQAVLGAMMLQPDVIGDVIGAVRQVDFYRAEHQVLFWVMVEMYTRGKTIDALTVSEVLRRMNQFDECGGSVYLVHLVDTVPATENARYYASVVAEKAGLRRLLDASAQIRALANSDYDEIDQVYNRAYSIVSEAVSTYDSTRGSDSSTVVAEVLAEIADRRQHGGPRGATTGFADIDRWTGGFCAGELIIVAGAPSMGKSAFAMQCAEGIAHRHGPVIVVSLEMTTAEIMHRQISFRSGINLHRLRSGNITDEEMAQVTRHGAAIAADPISYHDRGVDTAGLIRQVVRKQRKPPAAVIIDYLQIMRIDQQTSNRAQDIGAVTRDLKGLARDHQCPVILLSQLSRQVAQRRDNEPILSDLRDSSAIEADADMVLFVHRPNSGHYGGKEAIGEGSDFEDARVIIAKQRNGPTGAIPMTFRRSCAAWGNAVSESTAQDYSRYMHEPKRVEDDPFGD